MSNVLLIYITLKVSKLNPYCLPCHLSEKISQNIPDLILCVLIYQESQKGCNWRSFEDRAVMRHSIITLRAEIYCRH